MSYISAMPRQARSGCYKHIMVNLSTEAPCSQNRNSVLIQLPSSLSLMADFFFFFFFGVYRQWAAVPHQGWRCCQAQRWHEGDDCHCAEPAVCEYHLAPALILQEQQVHPPLLLNRVCYDCRFVFDPIQDRSRAAKYQVSPDLQHVLFAFEVKLVRDDLECYLALCHFQVVPL